jgi:uncharacterized RDD family membrane protein YckC
MLLLAFYIHSALTGGTFLLTGASFWGLAVTFVGIAVAVEVLYFGVLVSLWGRTVGDVAVGIRVVREEAWDRNLPLGRAVLRAIIWWGPPLLSLLPGPLGVFAVLGEILSLISGLRVAWDVDHQGFHDQLGRALVVRTRDVVVLVPADGGALAHLTRTHVSR